MEKIAKVLKVIENLIVDHHDLPTEDSPDVDEDVVEVAS